MSSPSPLRSVSTAGNMLRRWGPYIYKVQAWLDGRKRTRPQSLPVRRILMMNGAHIGDMVISTSILQVLQRAFPQAEIGVVAGIWSMPVLRNYPGVVHTHCIDHWLLNRGTGSAWAKWRHHRKTRSQALAQIRELQYDLALCVYPHFLADFLDVAWQAGIPRRIAFRHSLCAPLATDLVDMSQNPFVHQSEVQAEVLRPLALDVRHMQHRRSFLPDSPPSAIQEVCALLGVDKLGEFPYDIIHMGSGARNRELPPEFWHRVALHLSKSRYVLFTGKGIRESANIEKARSGVPNTFNACDRLSWEGFVAAIRHARILYGVESMAGHVAAAVGTPSRLAYTGTGGVARWRPDSPLSIIYSNHLPCAPCYRVKGCKEMTCLSSISSTDLTMETSN